LAAATLLAAGPIAQMNADLWVADRASGDLQRLSMDDGSVLSVTPLGSRLEGISRDGFGNAWIAVPGPSREVVKVSRLGDVLGKFPATGAPLAIAAAADKTVWYTQRLPNALVRLSFTGETISAVPLPGDPRGLTIDVYGRIWVTLYEREGRVLRFDRNGNYLDEIAVGKGPWSIATSWLCCVWVANHRGKSLYRLSLDGEITQTVNFHGFPRDIAVDRDGGVWVALPDFDRIDHFTRAGTWDMSVAVGDNPINLSVDGEHTVWVVCQGDGTVVRVSESGEILGTFPVGADPVAGCDFTGFAFVNTVKPLADVDGDLFRNRSEIIAGYNPFRASSYPTEIELLSDVLPGQPVQLLITDVKNAGKPFRSYLSLTNRPRWSFGLVNPCDLRMVPVNPLDPLFASTFGEPMFYPGMLGKLDAAGQAVVEVPMPPVLLPLKMYAGFFTMDPAMPVIPVRTISREFELQMMGTSRALGW